MVRGHGVDLVDVPRIAGMLREHGPRFVSRTFTSAEMQTCLGRVYKGDEARGCWPDDLIAGKKFDRAARRLAGRFAAKEATLKALGTGMAEGMSWLDVGVDNLPTGQPFLVLGGVAAKRAELLGITSWHLSISDTTLWAMASVIGQG